MMITEAIVSVTAGKSMQKSSEELFLQLYNALCLFVHARNAANTSVYKRSPRVIVFQPTDSSLGTKSQREVSEESKSCKKAATRA